MAYKKCRHIMTAQANSVIRKLIKADFSRKSFIIQIRYDKPKTKREVDYGEKQNHL